MTNEQYVNFMFKNNYYKKSMVCRGTCNTNMKFEDSSSYLEGRCWKCYTDGCTRYNDRKSLENDSFLKDFRTDLRLT